MRKRIAMLLLVLFGLSLVAAGPSQGLAASGVDADWTTRGRTTAHRNTVTEPFGMLRYAWQVDEIGVSATQPVFVNGAIYHLTSQGLWKIAPNGDADPAVTKLVPTASGAGSEHFARPSTAGLTYAEVGAAKTPALYFGTGDNYLCGYVLETADLHCRPLLGTAQVVATPLVFPEFDLVIMGDKGGYLWAIKGLSESDNPMKGWTKFTVDDQPTWITASPTPVPAGPGQLDFLTAAYVSGGGPGVVERMRVELGAGGQPQLLRFGDPWATGLWKVRMDDHHGMADGFALGNDQTRTYVNDMCGAIYWIDVASRVLYSDPADPAAAPCEAFANDLTAVGPAAEGTDTVYYTLRNRSSGGTSSYTAPGAVRAARWDGAGWQQLWETPTSADAWAFNTPPLVWGDKILIGTTDGYMLGFDKSTGKPVDFTAKDTTPFRTTSGADRMLLLKPDEQPFLATETFQALSGAGVQPIVSAGGTDETLLLMGVNYCKTVNVASWDGKAPTCADGQGNGRLVAFRASDDDPYIGALNCPNKRVEQFDAEAQVLFDSHGSAQFTGELLWAWATSDGQSGTFTVPLDIAPMTGLRTPIHGDATEIAPVTYTLTARLLLPEGFRDADLSNNEKQCVVQVLHCDACDVVLPTGGGAGLFDPDRPLDGP